MENYTNFFKAFPTSVHYRKAVNDYPHYARDLMEAVFVKFSEDRALENLLSTLWDLHELAALYPSEKFPQYKHIFGQENACRSIFAGNELC